MPERPVMLTIARSLLGSGRKMASALFAIVRRYPWQCLFIAALALFWWQTQRANGWQHKAALERTAHRQTKKNFTAAMDEWKRQADAAKAERARLRREAKEVSRDAQSLVDRMSADNAGLRTYIADYRLRWTGNPALRLDSGAADRDPALPPDRAARSLVATSEADLEACDAAYVYASGAHAFANLLRARGLATPAIAPAPQAEP